MSYFDPILTKLESIDKFLSKFPISIFTEIGPVGIELFHAERSVNGPRDMANK